MTDYEKTLFFPVFDSFWKNRIFSESVFFHDPIRSLFKTYFHFFNRGPNLGPILGPFLTLL